MYTEKMKFLSIAQQKSVNQFLKLSLCVVYCVCVCVESIMEAKGDT